MGELADDMMSGTSCSLCGCYFKDGAKLEANVLQLYSHGFPVACKDCWRELTGSERQDAISNGLQKATADTL